MTYQTHIERAIKIAGSQAALARKAGVAQQTISWLLTGGAKNVSPSVALKIEKATGGEVTRRDLIPEMFEGDAA